MRRTNAASAAALSIGSMSPRQAGTCSKPGRHAAGLPRRDPQRGRRKMRMQSMALILCAVLAAAANAEDYPNRYIRVVVGPGPDIPARLIGPKITEALDQQVVIEPRPGAGGVI